MFCRNGKCWEEKVLWETARVRPRYYLPVDYFMEVLKQDFWYSFEDDQGNPMMKIPTFGSILEHVRRVQNADLSFPIVLTPEGDIADGVHRLMRCMLEEKTTILCCRLEEMP
jgi:hypothetical protein